MPITYYPALTTRVAEMKALARLAGPTKDNLLPLLSLQAWPYLRRSDPILTVRSLDEYQVAMEGRLTALDLALPRTDLDSAIADQGRVEVAELRAPANGFENFCMLLEGRQNFIPTVQWSADEGVMSVQLRRLLAFGRGMAIRLRRSDGWNPQGLQSVLDTQFGPHRLIVFFDCEQISRGEDLTLLAQQVQARMIFIGENLAGRNRQFVVLGSSWPSGFAEIDPQYGRLPIRERQLFSLLNGSPALTAAGITLHYGDHAAVFAADREPAFRGAPRVDYARPNSWMYHRRPGGTFQQAAAATVAHTDWDPNLLCWGALEIQRAANGNMAGLNAPAPWTASRINIHLHQQANFDSGGSNPVDEDWID